MRRPWIPILAVAGPATLAAGYFTSAYLRSSSSTEPAPTNLVALDGPEVRIDKWDRVKPLRYDFRLHNPTPDPIQILEVRSSCACTTGELDRRVIQPGETVALTAVIRSFDAFAPSYRQSFTVLTDRGELVLRLFGDLPRPSEPLYRPRVLYLDPLPGVTVVERTVHIRIPRDCYTQLRTEDVRRSGAEKVEFRLTEEPPTEMFREFTLSVKIAAEDSGDADGVLEMETGCGLVSVVVKSPRR